VERAGAAFDMVSRCPVKVVMGGGQHITVAAR